MTKSLSLEKLRKILLRLPVSERRALVKRAQLKSVDSKHYKHKQFRNDILCNLQEKINTDSEVINLSSESARHNACLPALPVAQRDKRHSLETKQPEGPINNFPSFDNTDGGVPDAVTLEVFALRRRNAELTAKVEGLNNKLTVALECLYSLRRFVQLWVFEGQGETYDQVHSRLRRLTGTIEHIEDRTVGPAAPYEIPERWRKATKDRT